MSPGRWDVLLEGQRSGSSHAVRGSGVPCTHSHTPRLETIPGSAAGSRDSRPSIVSVLCLPLQCPRLQERAATDLADHQPLPATLTPCSAAPRLELVVCCFGSSWAHSHCCSGHMVDCTSTASSYQVHGLSLAEMLMSRSSH